MENLNKIGNINTNDISIQADNSPFSESFYFVNLLDESVFKRFIKNTERMIRTSREYHRYIKDLRENITDLNTDNVMFHVTGEEASLEFHHYPFTLYELVEIEARKQFLEDKNFNTFTLARDIMKLHNEHKIGIVPLSKTLHELAHSGDIFISESQIFGKFKDYVIEYDRYITPDLKHQLGILNQNTLNNVPTNIRGYLYE